jgi:hypothetical protein
VGEGEPRDFTALLKKIRERPDATLLESVLLRSQSLAVYAPRTSATSAWRSRPTRTSPRRSAAIPTCCCIARSSTR